MDKILVVDDVPDNVKLLEQYLEYDGYEVVTARDGQEALDVAAREFPTVILLDIMMPVLDGIETCRILKETPELKHIPVIMVSAKNQDEDIIRGIDVGAMDYVAKPIDYPVVAARIRSAIRIRRYEDSIRTLNEELQRALRARSSFLATMSHEIRHPITAIIGLSEILKDGVDPGVFNKEQALETIYNNSHYLLDMINNLLDLSKAESGALTVEMLSCDLFNIIAEVDSMVRLKALEKGLVFSVDYHYPLPVRFLSDPTRLKQILMNLISNAVKFTGSGSVSLQIAFDEEESVLSFEVIDTGIGMSEEEYSILFEPFQQANESITRRFGGTGLGLTIAKEIVEKLKGTIEVSSEAGEGSTFRVEIPISDVHELVQESPKASTSSPSLDAQKWEGRVLVIEDEPINQKLIKYTLQRVGIDVDIASDGDTGILRGKTDNYDLIFVDRYLPDMSGVEVVELLKASGVRATLVALTASRDVEDLKAFLNAGCKECVSKPFERADLYSCLNRNLGAGEIKADGEESPLYESDSFKELVNDYITGLPERMEQIRASLESEDWSQLFHFAHRLTGSSVFGFQQLSLLSRLLEEYASKENDAGCYEVVGKIQHEIENIQAAVTSD